MRARLCAVFLFRDGVWQRKAVEARYNELAELARQDIDTVWTESGEVGVQSTRQKGAEAFRHDVSVERRKRNPRE